MEKYTITDTIFKSIHTTIQQATRNEDGLIVIIKKPVEVFPTNSLIESFKKDFNFTKNLHDTDPSHFVKMIEMIEEKSGSVILVEESIYRWTNKEQFSAFKFFTNF
eukprot:gene10113-2532_t